MTYYKHRNSNIKMLIILTQSKRLFFSDNKRILMQNLKLIQVNTSMIYLYILSSFQSMST